MSQALLEQAAGGQHTALSAGTTPEGRVHPEVVAVMREHGIDPAERKPQGSSHWVRSPWFLPQSQEPGWHEVATAANRGSVCLLGLGCCCLSWRTCNALDQAPPAGTRRRRAGATSTSIRFGGWSRAHCSS